MIDETFLDTPADLARADRHGLLPAAASAGAQVRTATRGASESALTSLRPEGRPSTVLLAGPGPEVPLAAGLLAALGDGSVRIEQLPPTGPHPDPGSLRWALPRWAGPLDLLVITTEDGSEPGLTDLLERAHRRGVALATVAPLNSSLAQLTIRHRSLTIESTSAPHTERPAHPAAPGPAWSLLTPVLLLADRLGICPADPGQLESLADRLDATAERCGPVAPTDRNPAKELALRSAGELPLLWSDGAPAGAAARHAAGTFAALPGVPVLWAPLPAAMAEHDGLLRSNLLGGASSPLDDLFRDRVEEPPPLRPHVVLVQGPPAGGAAGHQPADFADPSWLPSPVPAARDLTGSRGTAVTEVTATAPGEPLEIAGELVAQLDFTAIYLAVATGTAP